MSEQLLKAILNLLAIVAKEGGIQEEERLTIREFLSENLSSEDVLKYLELLDHFSEELGDEVEHEIQKSCERINRELTREQKFVLILYMWELILADQKVTPREKELVALIGKQLFLTENEVGKIKEFISSNNFYEIDSKDFLILNSGRKKPKGETKHIGIGDLSGEILILRLPEIETYFIKYRGDETLFLNGIPLKSGKSQVFATGSVIRGEKVEPIYYSDISGKFLSTESSLQLSFTAENITFKFKGGKIGLRDIHVIEEEGKLIGLMGGSGAGKSTLLNVLNGLEKPSEGTVTINGIDIHRENDKVQGVLGYVPQDDLLIEDLTVFQNLYFAAKLSFTKYSDQQIREIVDGTIKNLGLSETRNLKVGSPLDKTISGGQRKRVNIGLELLREPSILFVDEPTSGLSSRDSENIMDLLKELSLKGKLIFVVIHQPSSDIFKMFDRLIILDVGGYQIYYGNPVEAESYFKKIVNLLERENAQERVKPEQVFNIIERKVVNEYGRLTDQRKTPPKKWHKHFKEKTTLPQKKQIAEPPTTAYKVPSKLSQLKIFLHRDILSKISNRQYMVINLLEAPILAFLLAYIVRYYPTISPGDHYYIFSKNINIPAFFFMSIIVALFMGLTISAEEIIKDRRILRRESFLNLSWNSYLLSKVIILFGFSAIQTFLYVMIGDHILEIDGMNFRYWLILFSTSCFANLLGLNISSGFNSAITIYILIPLLLIPQLILSGVVVKFDRLNPHITTQAKVPIIGELMTSRWAFEAAMVTQFKDNDFEKMFYPYDKIMANADFKNLYYIPTLESHLNFSLRHIKNDTEKTKYHLNILRNEINNELAEIGHSQFPEVDQLTLEKFDSVVYQKGMAFLKSLNRFYLNKYNEASELKDGLVSRLTANPELFEKFEYLKEEYQNESIAAIVKNLAETNRIVEEDGELIQKIYPIYMDPEPESFIDFRTQFFVPQKYLFGYYIDTLYFNLGVIWLMTFVMYATLYHEVIRKMLSTG